MLNPKLGKQLRILGGMLISAALAAVICAQSPSHLQVVIGPNQQISILARQVSYGEVLRALRAKLGWQIEIPPLADELKLSYASVEASRPQDALRKLLEGSGLGYAFFGEANSSGVPKVVVIPLAPRETKTPQGTASTATIPENATAGTSSPVPAQVETENTLQPNPNPVEQGVPQQPPPALSTTPLSDAINMIGAPPGVSLSDVGKSMTLPMSDAAKIIGAPPGMPATDIGKTKTLPLPTGPGKHP